MADFPTHPSGKFINVTKSDTLPLKYVSDVTGVAEPKRCRGIAIGTAGNLAIKDDNGTAVTIPANTLAIGVMHPISTDYVMSTNTTASEIVAYF